MESKRGWHDLPLVDKGQKLQLFQGNCWDLVSSLAGMANGWNWKCMGMLLMVQKSGDHQLRLLYSLSH